MAIMDVLVQSTHLTLLLINIDFLIDPSKMPLLLELAIHIFIGWLIYFIFLLIYHVFKPLYKLSYVLLMIVFASLYPSLIAMAKRSFFHFNWTEYGLWMIAHIIFMILMACSISYFSKKKY
jgi:hypothetical protein